MRVYYFTSQEHGLSNVEKRRLKISRLLQLNDLFEFYAVEVKYRWQRDLLRKTLEKMDANSGLICFSKSWQNPVMWGHYARSYTGMCLGFDVPDNMLGQVNYIASRFPWPSEADNHFIRKLLFSKFSHWSYEDEYRAYGQVDEKEGGHYFMSFGQSLTLRQVITGPKSSVSRGELNEKLGDLKDQVECFKARAAFRSFRVIRNEKDSLWT